MNLQEIVKRARAAYRSGICQPRQRTFGVDEHPMTGEVTCPTGLCCPQGAALIGLPFKGSVANSLGITEAEMWAFTEGFDGLVPNPSVEADGGLMGFYSAGVDARKEWIEG